MTYTNQYAYIIDLSAAAKSADPFRPPAHASRPSGPVVDLHVSLGDRKDLRHGRQEL